MEEGDTGRNPPSITSGLVVAHYELGNNDVIYNESLMLWLIIKVIQLDQDHLEKLKKQNIKGMTSYKYYDSSNESLNNDVILKELVILSLLKY